MSRYTTVLPEPTTVAVGDSVTYAGSVWEHHGPGIVAAVHRSPSGRVMVHVALYSGEYIRCRRDSVRLVPTATRCDNCGVNADAFPLIVHGDAWNYCGPCSDAACGVGLIP